MVQMVFKRYELKYMLEPGEKEKILEAMSTHMAPDRYGRTTVRNIYFDTDDFRLIRRSIERPAYKEKLRLRSYGKATAEATVFVELKKKYQNVVYKRRLPMREAEAMAWICRQQGRPVDTQISREIDYFLHLYPELKPSVFLCYEREAYYDKDGEDFRVTFDENILCRQQEVSLCADAFGSAVLPEGKVLMEIKCMGGIPLWMARVLSREQIYKTRYSKYGSAYSSLIFPKMHGSALKNRKGF